MPALNLKPAHKAVKAYFDELNAVAHLDFYDEGAVSPAFAELLRHCGRQTRLTLVEQFPLARAGRNLRVDGALVDTFKIPHGYWEAKDTKDDLEKEIQKKFDAGYPRDNILLILVPKLHLGTPLCRPSSAWAPPRRGEPASLSAIAEHDPSSPQCKREVRGDFWWPRRLAWAL